MTVSCRKGVVSGRYVGAAWRSTYEARGVAW